MPVNETNISKIKKKQQKQPYKFNTDLADYNVIKR